MDIPFYGIHCVLAVLPDGGPAYQSERDSMRFRTCLRAAIIHGQHVLKSAVLTQSEGHLVVLHFRHDTKPNVLESQIRVIYKAMREQLPRLPGIRDLHVGVGEVQGSLMLLAQSCRQANRAIVLGRKTNGSEGLYFFGQMGIYSLVDAKSMEEFHSNCAREMEAFAKTCGVNTGIYLDTLEAYFDYGESPTAVATALGLHLNTVRYRLKRISELLGEGFFKDGKEKMRMYMLIKMQKII
jgi:sugar diacid utilization regulator